MKFWKSEHVFQHPWDTVVQAAWRKYPNPMNPSVVGIDTVERNVTKDGLLQSHRLMTTEWGLPKWVINMVGMTNQCYVSEHSEVDPKNKVMKLQFRNLTLCSVITIEEKLVYSPHPEEQNSTLLKQEAIISVQGVPLTTYMEGLVVSTCSSNAQKGRQAMEWVIGRIKSEAGELRRIAQEGMGSMTGDLKRMAQEGLDNVTGTHRPV